MRNIAIIFQRSSNLTNFYFFRMAALKKSGEEEWKKKIPRFNKPNSISIGEENKNVLNTLVTTLEENNKNNNSPAIVVNNNGDSNTSGLNNSIISILGFD